MNFPLLAKGGDQGDAAAYQLNFKATKLFFINLIKEMSISLLALLGKLFASVPVERTARN